MPYCPKCGVEFDEGENYCPACGQRISEGKGGRVRGPSDRRAVDHISLGFNLAMARPMVFAPVLLGGIISVILDNF